MQVQRVQLDCHLQSASKIHLELAYEKLTNTEAKLNDTEAKLSDAHKKLRKTQEKLNETEEKLEVTRQGCCLGEILGSPKGSQK